MDTGWARLAVDFEFLWADAPSACAPSSNCHHHGIEDKFATQTFIA